MDRGQLAYDNFLSGYNCSQSVILAYKDFFPPHALSLILDMSSSFGGGMGRLREVCGTLSGAFIVLGKIYGYHDAGDNDKKAILYKKIQEVAKRFEEKNGAIVCRTLLGLSGKSDPTPEKRSEEYYKKRPCPEYCRSSASILQKFLEEEGILDKSGNIIS